MNGKIPGISPPEERYDTEDHRGKDYGRIKQALPESKIRINKATSKETTVRKIQ
jgi:hypothetical protein